ncbi:hypothetical protein GEMRC1_003952 [Eukaryota sp. GEM-RC1]
MIIECSKIISSLFGEPLFFDQTIIFGERTYQVSKIVLAASSTFFRNLWFLEFKDQNENPSDFSQLPVSVESFSFIIDSFYGVEVNVTVCNCFDMYYLVHYFQVELLITQIESILTENLCDWSWLKKFVIYANENDDIRALKFAGPFFIKASELSSTDVVALSTQSVNTLVEFCTNRQSMSWLIQSMVKSIKSSCFDLDEFSSTLSLFAIDTIGYKEWDEFLLEPLQKETTLKSCLMEFLFDKLKLKFFDSLTGEVGQLRRKVSELEKENVELKTRNEELIEKMKTSTCKLPFEVKISTVSKHDGIIVSSDQKSISLSEEFELHKCALGELPLSPGQVYQWKVSHTGSKCCAIVGVIDASLFSSTSDCYQNCHGFNNNATLYGCLSGITKKWTPGAVITVKADLINYLLTIASDDSSINVTGTLPSLSGSNYFPFFNIWHKDQTIKLID